MYKKLESAVTVLENGMVVTLIVVMSVAVFAQVLFRYAMEIPLSWTEELSRYCLIWLTFIGASLALREKGHFALEYLLEKLPDRMRLLAELGLLLVIEVFLGVMLYTGLVMLPITALQVSASLRITMDYVYLAIPIGSAFMLIHNSGMIWDKFAEWRQE